MEPRSLTTGVGVGVGGSRDANLMPSERNKLVQHKSTEIPGHRSSSNGPKDEWEEDCRDRSFNASTAPKSPVSSSRCLKGRLVCYVTARRHKAPI